MCKLTKQNFTLARKCRVALKDLIYNNNDVSIIADIILAQYNVNVVAFVLAATILSKSSVLKDAEYSGVANEWAEKYKDEIGFLSDSINIKNAPVRKIENLTEVIKKRKVI